MTTAPEGTVYFLITVALAGTAGFTWGFIHHDGHMPYPVVIGFSIGSALAAELVEHVIRRRRTARRPRRRAHARPPSKPRRAA
ncbi:hypothetical protein [Streptomyces griseosporeus]